MIHVGLLGHPVAHSLSPAMHAAAFDAAGVEGTYEALDVQNEGLTAAIAGLRERGWRGFNVTVPHKQAVFELCDSVDEPAKLAGAVNTVVLRDDGTAHGSNTDVQGFIESLRELSNPQGSTALVLGAGGAARAVVVALAHAGCEQVTVSNRSLARAGRLVCVLGHELPGRIKAAAFNPWQLERVDFRVVINATSAGMGCVEGEESWARADRFFANVPFDAWPDAVAFDLVYSPAETPFTKRAREAGRPALSGLGMLARQGALAFEQWTGVAASQVLPAMLRSLE